MAVEWYKEQQKFKEQEKQLMLREKDSDKQVACEKKIVKSK